MTIQEFMRISVHIEIEGKSGIVVLSRSMSMTAWTVYLKSDTSTARYFVNQDVAAAIYAKDLLTGDV